MPGNCMLNISMDAETMIQINKFLKKNEINNMSKYFRELILKHMEKFEPNTKEG